MLIYSIFVMQKFQYSVKLRLYENQMNSSN